MKKNFKGEIIIVVLVVGIIVGFFVKSNYSASQEMYEDSDESTAKMIISAAETSVARGDIDPSGTYSCDELNIKVSSTSATGDIITSFLASSCGVEISSDFLVTKVFYGESINGVAPEDVWDIYK